MKPIVDQILVASDHAGFKLKTALKAKYPNIRWIDLGPETGESVDYPDYADRVAKKINEEGGMGVLICGSGQGMCIRANRYPNVRAAMVWDENSARLAREHNDANILCLGARLVEWQTNYNAFEVFFTTYFAGGRHGPRVDKLKGALK